MNPLRHHPDEECRCCLQAADALDAERVKREALEARLANVLNEARAVMQMLEKLGPSVVPHLLDTDENAGQRLRTALADPVPQTEEP